MNDKAHSMEYGRRGALGAADLADRAATLPYLSAGVPRSSAPFIVCLATLGAAALSLTVAKHQGWLQLVKKAVPLRKSLDRMTLGSAESRYRLTRQQPLSADMEHELGTKEYATWLVEDLRAREDEPWRRSSLFITYYTGKPDQVPHVPEECMYQGGMDGLEDRSVEMPLPEPPGKSVAVRTLMFHRPHDVGGHRVFYTFSCNGDFYDNRNSVRNRMMNFREQSLYYSKVELSFPIDTRHEPKQELGERAFELLRTVLPVLMKEHWPDWDAVMRQQATR